MVVPGPNLVIDCRLPAAGRYHVILFANTVRYGSYDYVGQLAVNNAP